MTFPTGLKKREMTLLYKSIRCGWWTRNRNIIWSGLIRNSSIVQLIVQDHGTKLILVQSTIYGSEVVWRPAPLLREEGSGLAHINFLSHRNIINYLFIKRLGRDHFIHLRMSGLLSLNIMLV